MNKLRNHLLIIALGCTFSILTFGSVENVPKDVQTAGETFKLGKFVRSGPGLVPFGSHSVTRIYYFENGAVDTIQGEVFHEMANGVIFFVNIAVWKDSPAAWLSPPVLKVGIQQKLGGYVGASTFPTHQGRMTLHFENGDVWLDYRGRDKDTSYADFNDAFVGMLLEAVAVSGKVLLDAADKDFGRFIRMENGIFYFERGSI